MPREGFNLWCGVMFSIMNGTGGFTPQAMDLQRVE